MSRVPKKRKKVKGNAGTRKPTPEGRRRALKGWETRRRNQRTAERKEKVRKKGLEDRYKESRPDVRLVGMMIAKNLDKLASTEVDDRSFVTEQLIDQLIAEGSLIESEESVIQARMFSADEDGRLDDEAARIFEDYWPKYDLHEIYTLFYSP